MTTLIVTATPSEGQSEAMGRYLQAVQPLLAAAGGTPVKRVRVTNTIAGNAGTQLVLIMDFDSAEAITAVFASEEYNALLPDRNKGFAKIEILVTEALG